MQRRLIALAAVALILSGCSQPGPTLAHGQPVEHWVRALHGPDAKARKRAADVLGNVGAADATVVPALSSALKDQDRGVREAAVLALLKMGPAAKGALPALIEASKDSDAKVRSYAARAVEKLQVPP